MESGEKQMTDEDIAEIEYELDWAERRAHELRNELAYYPEDGSEWLSVWHELNEAENEVEYIRNQLEQ
jgi:vacuolar-type H+-ATPase subunit I/STV1